DRAAEQQPRRYPESIAHSRIDRIVEGRERDNHAEGEHRPGHCIAEAGETARDQQRPSPMEPVPVSEKESDQHGEDGRQTGYEHAVAGLYPEAGPEAARMRMKERVAQQD